MLSHDSISFMTKFKNESVIVADFGEFGSIAKIDISDYAKNKNLSEEEIYEILNTIKSVVDSQEFNPLISVQK